MMNKEYEILKSLKPADKVCLIGHSTPDADALCSMSVFYNFLTSQLNITNVDMFSETDQISETYSSIMSQSDLNPTPKTYDYVITLDTSNPILLGKYESLLSTCSNVIVIDHHQTNLKYGKYNIVEICSSTCELIYKILLNFNYHFTDEDYGKIYAGIITDTGNLTVGAISEETFKIAGVCYKNCNGQEIYKHFFSNTTLKTQNLFAKAIQNCNSYEEGKILISHITKQQAQELNAQKDDYMGIVNRLAQTKDSDMVCFIYPKTDLYYVSMRVKKGYDAATIAKKYGGGGHLGAAAFTSEKPISELENIILNEFKNEIKSKNLLKIKNPFKNK